MKFMLNVKEAKENSIVSTYPSWDKSRDDRYIGILTKIHLTMSAVSAGHCFLVRTL